MPIHINPMIRFMEEVKEQEKLIPVLDSPAVTLFKAAEISGTKPKIVPLVYYHGIQSGKIQAS